MIDINQILIISSLILSIISIFISSYVLNNKDKFLFTPQELCGDRQGLDFKKCYNNARCIQDIDCALHGQPANRGHRPSHAVIGNQGDSNLINN